MDSVGFVSYSIAATAYLALTFLLCTRLKEGTVGGWLVLATAGMSIWAGIAAYASWDETVFLADVLPVEAVRALLWCWFLLKLLGYTALAGSKIIAVGRPALLVAVALLVWLEVDSDFLSLVQQQSASDLRIISHLLLAIISLFLIEQLYRNTQVDKRWAVKHLYLGLTVAFAFDFILYAEALLYSHINLVMWNARGLVDALIVPLIALSATRNPKWAVDVFVSRRVIYRTSVLVITGGYLLVMAIAGYYIRDFGGEWSEVFLAVFITSALVGFFVLLFSAQIRAKFKVLINKHFFHFKYDYRDEWMRLNNALVSIDATEPLQQRCIKVMADTVDSPAGVLWCKDKKSVFQPVYGWNMRFSDHWQETRESELVRFLMVKKWVINKTEYDANQSLYDGVAFPDWFTQNEDNWLIVPLINHDDLFGFIVLAKPRAKRTINWEEHDLLKMIGYQLTNYLALIDASEELANARQFEAYNRLSAFVVHDLKNVVAQLSLIVTNASKHKHNPEFIDDALETLTNAVAKMNRMLEQLRKGKIPTKNKSIVDLNTIIAEVARQQSGYTPQVMLVNSDQTISLNIDRAKLVSVLGHLVQNAQDATEDSGWVKLTAGQDTDNAIISITDNGVGMDAEFIKTRLFKPFDTTKGNAGMGIGVFDAKEFIESQDGIISVNSEPGKGTEFMIRLPLHQGLPNEATKSTEGEQACQI
ncbi:PEP-CTERM system histidine kinase PrsK [Endozoicomonas sp. SM1973]|uniref:histidine kinase n=1 Tax=Spartinivicinus marinus TaxID=2994442 RepID=A0A853IEV6_9GAMM|nr:XrtA/PEP-CTERM system histidine kinase PrsK [Spartinivicinus marinus]MCX4025003.1 PEP-CTERM system histidine kinase PrsK [Spartinivicinus marinus]NYZ67695.1 PEP-CTERM system histidine kinase PrsK [Spartinivicinus marinus]